MRQTVLRAAWFTGVFGCAFSAATAPESDGVKIRTTTHTYKRVGDLELKADAHRTDDDVTRPVIVWIHGGALMNGGRQAINPRAKDMMLDAGYAVVSIDYRLAPESKLPDIIEDIEDAFAWIRESGPALFNVDTSRIAVMGGSAGGYLTLATGHRVSPRPAVLVSLFGYGDLVGDWYSKPSKHPRHNRAKIEEDKAREQVAGPPISNQRNRKGNAGLFYMFCRQHGLWPQAVSGWDPHDEVDKYIPYMPVRNVTKDYPPSLLIHGTEDTDVPYEQSTMMAEVLKKNGVEHKLIAIPGAEHGLNGGDPELIDSAYRSMLEFVNRHMKRE